jgi:glycosyltransferase involved in cell wall biosynthesis
LARIVVLSRRSIRHPLSGGASRYIHEILRRLADHHSITVLAGGSHGTYPLEVIDGITYRHFPGAFHRVLLPARYLSNFAHRSDLLIDNSDVGIPWLSPLYSRVPRITVIHQLVREIFFDELPSPASDLGFALEPLIYRLYSKSRIVAVSKSTAHDLEYCGVPEQNIEVIEPGCSTPGFPPLPLSERWPETIGCVSRLVKYKGLQLAFKALKRMANERQGVRLLVAGSGPYQKELSRTAEMLGVSKNVSFLGRLSDQSKLKLYGKSRVAIYPSYREGFGISVIEANSVGTPVVGWNVPGSRDSIVNETTGLLAPFPNDEAFANHVDRLLRDDTAWLNLSNRASEWAQEHSWDKSAKQFEDTIEAALAEY